MLRQRCDGIEEADLAQVEKLVEAVLDHLAAAHHRLLIEDARSLRPALVHALQPELERGAACGGEAERRDAGVVDPDEVRREEWVSCARVY
eukprot:scaffold71751_cov63-Phaeocystis_antarctica.AAC.2